MSKKFKAQASSSRVAPTTIFGGFGSIPTSSLSYLSEPPNLSSIADGNLVVIFKNMLKKDSTTKSKALEDLRAYVALHPNEKEGGLEESILEAWVKLYPRISVDNSRRVRELSHHVQFELLKAAKKRMEKHLPKVVGAWLVGIYDKDRPVARAANEGVTSFMNTNEKVTLFWKRCQVQILEYAQEAINETPQSLSDERTVNAEESQAKYNRVMGASVSLVVSLLERLAKDDIAKNQDQYDKFMSNGKKLWSFASSDDPAVRRATCDLLTVCLDTQEETIEKDLQIISHSFIHEALRVPQSSSAVNLLEVLRKLTTRFPQVWTSAYKDKKTPLSRLANFIEKGSQGGPPIYWQTLQSLIANLPLEVLPSHFELANNFLKSFRTGMSNKEELRSNSSVAWLNYVQVTRDILSYLNDHGIMQTKLLQEALYPIFDQYLRPSTENFKWSIINGIPALATAYTLCSSVYPWDEKFGDEGPFQVLWESLRRNLTQSLYTSLPQQSKDYQKSQVSVTAESQRWFVLLAEVLRLRASDFAIGLTTNCADLLINHSNEVVKCALEVMINRNGKPYSAAATVEAALRLSPSLMQICPRTLDSLRVFFSEHLSELILSPSSAYLVSSLKLFRSLPNQEAFFTDVWNTTIEALLKAPEEESSQAITALISIDSVASIAQADPALQQFLLRVSVKVAKGGLDAWPLMEAVFSSNVLTETIELRLVEDIVEFLDAENSNVNCAFQALEFLSKRRPELLLHESNIHRSLVTRLLSLTELRGSQLSQRAIDLELTISTLRDGRYPLVGKTSLLQIVRSNLDHADSESLNIETVIQQSKILISDSDPMMTNDLLPNTSVWTKTLYPMLMQHPDDVLSITSALHGAIHWTLFVCDPEPAMPPVQRDSIGYSIPLRIALYTTEFISDEHFTSHLSQDLQVDILYNLSLTMELARDQLMLQVNMLWASVSDFNITELESFLSVAQAKLNAILSEAKSWRQEKPDDRTSAVVGTLISKLMQAADLNTALQWYAGQALSRFISQLVEFHGWQNTGAEDWISRFCVSRNIGTCRFTAMITGLQEVLGTSKHINVLCNQLISDYTGLSEANSTKALGLLAQLNAILGVYDEGDLPVAQNRLVFAVKKILSWTSDPNLLKNSSAAECCRLLQRLLPAIQDVYGTHWEATILFCLALWAREDTLEDRLPVIHASLKLIHVLQNLQDVNEDLIEVLEKYRERISQGEIGLLQLPRPNAQSMIHHLTIIDELLLRKAAEIPLEDIKDLIDLYPLIASNNALVQSAAFGLLHRALPAVQELLSVDVLLEKRDAQLPEELLSLLLDAPSFDAFLHEESLADRVASTLTRGYLLSWVLVYDCYNGASFKVRNDYSEILKSYVGPLLNFAFNVLGHSAAHPIDLDKEGISASLIRQYDPKADLSGATLEELEHDLQCLLVHLYYLCLKFTPSLAKTWWIDCKSKQTRISVESWTQRFLSPLVIQDALTEVTRWSTEQDVAEDEKELIIKMSMKSREVLAGYEVDDMVMQIAIRLPANYPLEGVKVEGVNRVAVSEKRWKSWLMVTQGAITLSNGSILDGLTNFRKNVTLALAGHDECAICYSILSSDKKLPNKTCQTCQHLFHASCLFKWFTSSNQSTCPLCRNPFNYSANVVRSRRADSEI